MDGITIEVEMWMELLKRCNVDVITKEVVMWM